MTVVTTSYPRHAGDVAGTFVRDAVVALRAEGVDVRVVSPAGFRHYGIAYGDGIVNNLRAAPWKLLALPLFLLSFAAAARRASRGADLVHAHWLPSALPALATGKPFVLQLWGSDVALARRVAPLARRLLRRADVVVCASTALAADARRLGARDVRVIPSGVEIPARVAEPDDPPHALYVGRLSEEKGVRELAEAAAGLPLVVVGDGPLRSLFPQAVGFVPPGELGPYYERASVVVVPSRREGYGVVAREAMAHGRPVVATAVGGLVDAVEDGVTGVVVAPREPRALRQALERLLADGALRARLGAEARRRASECFSLDAAAACRRPPLRRARGDEGGWAPVSSPPQSEFPTLAEILARGSEEPPAAAPIVAVVEGPSEATDVERSLPAGSVVAIVSTTAIEVSGQGHHAATLAGLTELVRSNVGDILFVSGEARPTRSEVSGLTRSLASDSACTTVSLDGRSRPAVPGLPPPAVDTPRGGVVLVRRDDLLLAADEADLSSCFGERSPVAGWGPLVGSVLALLERPGFVHRASGGVSEAVDDAQGSPAPPRRKAPARILVDGSFLAHRLAGTQVQAWLSSARSCGRARTWPSSVPARSIPRWRRPSTSSQRRSPSSSASRSGSRTSSTGCRRSSPSTSSPTAS